MSLRACALYLHGAAYATMGRGDDHNEAHIFIYGSTHKTCPPLQPENVTCTLQLALKSKNLTIPGIVQSLKRIEEEEPFVGIHDSIPITVDCFAERAAIAMHMLRDELINVHAVVRHMSQSYTTSLEITPIPFLLRVCTKVYGNGGKVGDPIYLNWWMRRWQALGVSEVVFYVIDNEVPRSIEKYAVRHSRGTRLIVRRWPPAKPYTRAQYASQSKTASAELEVYYRTAMAHCATSAKEHMDWLLVVDTDEVLVLGPKSRPGMSLAEAALGALPTPGSLEFTGFRLPCERVRDPHNAMEVIFDPGKPWLIHPNKWELAKRASVDKKKRSGHQIPATGWKAMFRPGLENFIDAHGNGRYQVEDDMNHLVAADTAYIVHCKGPE